MADANAVTTQVKAPIRMKWDWAGFVVGAIAGATVSIIGATVRAATKLVRSKS